MTRQVLIAPANIRGIRAVFRRMAGQPFSWAYLGQTLSESLRVDLGFRGHGTKIDTSRQFHQAAEELREPYLTYLYKIGLEQRTLRWWLTSLAFRSSYVSKAYVRTCLLKVAIDLTADQQASEPLVLMVAEAPVRAALKANLARNGNTGARIAGASPTLSLEPFISAARMLSHRAFFVIRETTRLFLARRQISKPHLPNEPTTLILSTVSPRNRQLGSEFHKSFFGNLADELQQLGIRMATVPLVLPGVGYKNLLAGLRSSEIPVMVPHRYLSLLDVLWAALSTWRRPPPSSIPHFNNLDIRGLILDEQLRAWVGNWDSDALLLAALTRRWAAMGATIERIIYVYENQPWECALCWGARRYLPETALVGYQHARVPKLMMRYYLAPGGESEAPLPDRIVTVGNHTAQLLSASGYRPGQVQVGGSLQITQNGARSDSKNPDLGSYGDFVLIACSNGLEESEELVYLAAQLFGEEEQVHVVVKCHPIMPFERLRGFTSADLPQNVEVSNEPLSDLMLKSSVMVYSGSTVCVEALALELPVVHLRPQFDLDLDPLEAVPDVRLEATGLEELRHQVRWLLDHRTEYIAQHRQRWREVVRQIYEPVTEESYLAFVN